MYLIPGELEFPFSSEIITFIKPRSLWLLLGLGHKEHLKKARLVVEIAGLANGRNNLSSFILRWDDKWIMRNNQNFLIRGWNTRFVCSKKSQTSWDFVREISTWHLVERDPAIQQWLSEKLYTYIWNAWIWSSWAFGSSCKPDTSITFCWRRMAGWGTYRSYQHSLLKGTLGTCIKKRSDFVGAVQEFASSAAELELIIGRQELKPAEPNMGSKATLEEVCLYMAPSLHVMRALGPKWLIMIYHSIISGHKVFGGRTCFKSECTTTGFISWTIWIYFKTMIRPDYRRV